MKLHELRAVPGATKAPKRKGRGTATGQGKTAGRGMNGQKSRSDGTAIVKSCSMMEAVIYGVILSANIVKLLNAPPENRLNRAKSPVSLLKVCERTSRSIPGTGI